MTDVIDVDPGGTDHSPCRNCTHAASQHRRFAAHRGGHCYGGFICECPGLNSPAQHPPAEGDPS